MRTEIVTEAVNPAINLAGVKLYAFKNTDAYDAKIESLILPATKYVERYTGRKLINQELSIWLDRDEYVDRLTAYKNSITLSTLNVSLINSVTLYDSDNATSTVTSTDYRLSGDTKSASSKLVYNENSSISTYNLRAVDGVLINVTAGYGLTSDDVPTMLTQSLAVLIDHWINFGMKSSKDSLHDVTSSFNALISPYASTEGYF